MTLRIVLILSAFASVARAETVSLPAGADWMVVAPNPEQFISRMGAMLGPAGQLSPSLSQARMNVEIQRRCGLPLLDRDALAAAGVDTKQPWIFFEKNRAEYLAVSVHDRSAFTRTIDAWAQGRGLQARAPFAVPELHGSRAVVFSRGDGTRPATGYVVAADRAIILVAPAERTPALGAAWLAVDAAAPVDPPVAGPLLFWVKLGVSYKDGWLAVRPRSDGVDLAGSARQALPGWFERDATHAGWIRALTAEGDSPFPMWFRVMAGTHMAAGALQAWTPPADLSAGSLVSWMRGLVQLGPGALEILARTVDANALSSNADLAVALLSLVRPEVLFVDRAPEVINARFSEASSQLCAPSVEGDVVRGRCPSGTVAAARHGSTLAVGWGDQSGGPSIPEAMGGAPTLTCGAGIPLASGRINLAAIYNGTKGVGLLDALSNGAMAAAYGLISEYGGIMQVSRPVVGLLCVQPDRRLTLEAHWRFQAQ